MYWEKGSSHLICFRIAPAWWLVKLKRGSLWTNQMKPRSADSSLVRVFPRLAPSTLHQINLKARRYSYRPIVFTNPGKLSTENGWIVDEYDFNLKYLLCVLVSMEKFLQNVTFWKRWRLRQRCVSRFIDISLHVLGKSVDEKHFMRQCARGVS